MIRFDRTQRSIVAICACGRRELFTNQASADRWAAEHVNTAHADRTLEHDRAVTASRQRRHRRGDTP